MLTLLSTMVTLTDPCDDVLIISQGFTKKMTQPQELDLAGEAMGCEKKECCI